jgi:hypothetical protein
MQDYEKEYIDNFFKLQNYLSENIDTGNELDLLEEAKSDLTLQDLRAFFSVMADTASDGQLKKLLKSMVKTIAKMEIFKRKVPPIMRLKSPSPTVKSYTKN